MSNFLTANCFFDIVAIRPNAYPYNTLEAAKDDSPGARGCPTYLRVCPDRPSQPGALAYESPHGLIENVVQTMKDRSQLASIPSSPMSGNW